MKCKIVSSLVLVFTLVLLSCNHQERMLQDSTTTKAPPQPGIITSKQSPIPEGKISTSADSVTQLDKPVNAPAIDWDKKIIKTANVTVEVKNFVTYSSALYQSVKQFGGYIASQNQTAADEKMECTVSVKVPVAQFEALLTTLSKADAKLIEQNITSEDVTGEVVDIKARLEAKKQMRQKYLEFFKQAKNMEEVLQVQSEINELQELMESATGRVNYLTQHSAYSTINLTFYQPLSGYQPANEHPGFWNRVTSAFKTGGEWLADIAVAAVTIWPAIAIFVVLIIIKRRIYSGGFTKPKS